MRLFYSMMLFAVCLELASYTLWAFNFFPALGISYPFGNATDLNNLNNMFNIDLYSGLIGLAGIGVSIAALLLRQGTYALYAMLLFAIGIFFNLIKGFVFAIPNTVAALMPNQTNPFAYTNGVYDPNYVGANPIQLVAGAIVVFSGFIFLSEMVIQRNVS